MESNKDTKSVKWVPKKVINKYVVERHLKWCEETSQFTNYGPNVRYLEDFIRKFLEIDEEKAVICVCNGSIAIHILCAAFGYNDYKSRSLNWATQSFTFPPSAQNILDPVTVIDIDDEGGLDLDKVPEDIDGIIVTNIFGNAVNIEKYIQWAKENRKFLVFDNAATTFTVYKGKNSCNYGHGSIISFHHTKPLGFGEGGAIIVDKIYEQSVRRLINFGLDNHHPTVKWHPAGTNGKMSDISAIYILQYLTKAEDIIVHHHALYEYLHRKLCDKDYVELYPNFSDGTPFVSCFCLIFSEYKDELRKELISKDFYCRKYYKPLSPTPKALEIYNKILCIPCTIDVSAGDLDFFVKTLETYYE